MEPNLDLSYKVKFEDCTGSKYLTIARSNYQLDAFEVLVKLKKILVNSGIPPEVAETAVITCFEEIDSSQLFGIQLYLATKNKIGTECFSNQ